MDRGLETVGLLRPPCHPAQRGLVSAGEGVTRVLGRRRSRGCGEDGQGLRPPAFPDHPPSLTTRLPCAACAHGLSSLRLPAGTPTARSAQPHADMCTGQAGGRGRGARAAELTARRQNERGSRGQQLTLDLWEELSTQPQVSPGGCQVPLPSRALPHAGSARAARQPFPKRQTCTAGTWLQREASVLLSYTTHS